MNTLGIIVACGREEEVAPGTDTAFLPFGNLPLLAHILKGFQESKVLDGVIVAVSKERVDATLALVKRYGCTKVCGVVVGGASRGSTLKAVFSKMPNNPSIMVVQEVSRPFGLNVLEDVVKAAKRYGCGVAAHRLDDAVKTAPKGVKVQKTLERNTAWAAQTPQAFKTDVLSKIIASDERRLKIIDDESEFVRKPAEVHMVECGPCNIKIRSSQDLATATALMNANGF